jgi:hypothetical protein
MSRGRSSFGEAARAWVAFDDRYRRDMGRDTEKSDEALSVVLEIERCHTVHETSTSWRSAIAAIFKRERK